MHITHGSNRKGQNGQGKLNTNIDIVVYVYTTQLCFHHRA